jgi:methionyl-tRNA formyltransferase
MVNVHGSLLPRWRGAAPVHRAILAGDVETGVTIMEVVQALDAGPMLATSAVRIDPMETSAELEARLAQVGADLLVDVMDRLAREDAVGVRQDERLVTYAPRLTRADGVIDWRRRASDLHNQIRGLHPWPMVPVSWRGRRLVLVRARPAAVAITVDATPGTVIDATGDRMTVAVGDGALDIVEVQLEGRPVMDAASFLRGHTMARGEPLPPWPLA